MNQTRPFLLASAIAVMIVAVPLFLRQKVQAAPGDIILSGTVTSVAGEKMRGVTVSAKEDGKTITMTVFTDDSGLYYFPAMEVGTYRIWAQADTFATEKGEIDLSRTARRDFVLKPMKEYVQQLTGDEVVNALPEDTPDDKRLKQVFAHTCTNCHQPSFILQNRFDENGWLSIFKVMEHTTNEAIFSDESESPDPIIKYHEKELAKYMARMRGPGPSPLKFKLRPRPTGEAARVIIQEYDVPVDYSWDKDVMGHSGSNDGSDWSLGTPSNMNGLRGDHDAQADMNGNIWFSDEAESSDRTLARIDAKTGEVRNFAFPNTKPGLTASGHGIVMDKEGMLWFNLKYTMYQGKRKPGALGRIDPNTFKVDIYDVPKGMAGTRGTLDIDPQGYIWITTDPGVLRFDPKTHEFREFRSATWTNADGEGLTYGLAADSQGNAWWGQMMIDIVGKSNIETGKSEEIKLSRVPGQWELLTAEEKKMYDLAGSAGSSFMVTKPGMQGPRRLGADHNGDTVWVCDFWGGNMAKININTNKVEYIPYPNPYVGGYAAIVDKNHDVWTTERNADRIAKYDPKAKKWTEFRLPTLGVDPRWVSLLEKNDGTMQVIVAYFRTSKVARMMFRSEADMQALKQKVQSSGSGNLALR